MNAPANDRTDDHISDSTNDVANRAPSNLDLDAPATPYLDSNELIINMGPQHPATHGVLRVILKLDGEKVLGTDTCIAASKKSPRTAPIRCSIPTSIAWTTSPPCRMASATAKRSRS
jgi:hypothetical protein